MLANFSVNFCYKNASLSAEREGKGREGKGREGKGEEEFRGLDDYLHEA